MTARVANVALDCRDARELAGFWANVLGRPVDPGGTAEYASIGGGDASRAEPAWYFNRVAKDKVVKNRVHGDLVDPDPAAADALVLTGATVLGRHQMAGGHAWTVLQDPEGNKFCLPYAPSPTDSHHLEGQRPSPRTET